MSVRVVRHLRIPFSVRLKRSRWHLVHLCFLNRQCRAQGAPKRIYVNMLGFYVEWGEDTK